jgi:hypothetical protein
MRIELQQYWHNLWVLVSIAFNVVFLAGSPTQTTSGRLGRYKDDRRRPVRRGIAQTVCFLLHLVDPHHCDKVEAYEKSLGQHRPESLDDEPGD